MFHQGIILVGRYTKASFELNALSRHHPKASSEFWKYHKPEKAHNFQNIHPLPGKLTVNRGGTSLSSFQNRITPAPPWAPSSSLLHIKMAAVYRWSSSDPPWILGFGKIHGITYTPCHPSVILTVTFRNMYYNCITCTTVIGNLYTLNFSTSRCKK